MRLNERPDRDAGTPKSSRDGPLLDLTDAGVKKFIKQAKARGYVTMDELNKVLPSEEVTSEPSKTPWPCCPRWASTSSRPRRTRRSRGRRGRRARRDRRRRDDAKPSLRPHRRPGAHVPARDGLGRAAVPRGRDRHRQAHRGRPRHDDPRPVRKRPDLRSHHGLARRAGQRPHPAARGHRPGRRPTAC